MKMRKRRGLNRVLVSRSAGGNAHQRRMRRRHVKEEIKKCPVNDTVSSVIETEFIGVKPRTFSDRCLETLNRLLDLAVSNRPGGSHYRELSSR